jgi:hypothetical protein
MSTLLERVLEAHGGRERFAAAKQIEFDVVTGGLLLPMKLRPRMAKLITARASTTEPRVEIDDYPRPGLRGVFDAGRVRFEDAATGRLVGSRSDQRNRFRGVLTVRWDDYALGYFAGYAFWNYLTTPFLFTWPGFEVRELDAQRLHVTFPPDVPTHSREQVFEFGPDHLLRRLDYTAEVIGRWAKGAHFVFDHRTFGGLSFPTRRRVVTMAPGGRPLPGPAVVKLQFKHLRVS